MLYICTFFILIFNVLFWKSKKIYILDFIYFFILLGWSDGTYDTLIYIERYMEATRFESFTEPLFNLIIITSNNIGLDYRTFFIISAFIEILLILRFIKKYTNNIGCVVVLFIIYPMITLFVQLRFLLAFTIVLCFGINSLLKKGKFYELKFIIAILIATMIHYSSIIYLILLLADKFKIKKIIILVVIFMIAMSSLTFFTPILNFAKSFMGEEKVDILIEGSTNVDGNVGRTILILFMVLGYYVIYLYMTYDGSNENNKFAEKVLKYNILSLITIPLLHLMSSGFYRIPQSLLILNYIAISKYFVKNEKYKIKKKELILALISIAYAIILFLMMYHTREIYDLVIIPFFEQNAIL